MRRVVSTILILLLLCPTVLLAGDYEKAWEQLLINRRFKTNCNKTIAPGSFKELETFFNGIIKAEQRYVSFK